MNIHLRWKVLLLIIALLFNSSLCQTADDDQVDMLFPNYPHKVYSGFLVLDTFKEPKVVHYVFYPSQTDQTADPLVLWFSGSPGCSSLMGSFYQNGPFKFVPQQANLVINENAWNKKANLLYLEMPPGVGFSQGRDQVITDDSFAKDATVALSIFLARFPKYKKNEIYLTGHGYGAVFISYLAHSIIENNKDPYSIFADKYNLKGILLGNPCIKPDQCHATGSQKHSYYHYEFLAKRGYYNKKTWNQFTGACALNYESLACYNQRVDMDKQFNNTNTSMYNIYDKCYRAKNNSANYINTGCEDTVGIITFFNDPGLRKRWNINTDKQWMPCNDKIYTQFLGTRNAYTFLPYFIQNKLRIWIFSGDIDSFVPIIGTKKWIEELRHEVDMPVKRIWREWWVPGRHPGEDQVGGFIWQLRDFTFVTVKAAGFRAGLDQPQAMSQILAGFLAGKTLPYKNS